MRTYLFGHMGISHSLKSGYLSPLFYCLKTEHGGTRKSKKRVGANG